MNEYRHYCITNEPALSARKDLLGVWRKLRADNPAIARMVFRRYRNVKNILIDQINQNMWGLPPKSRDA